MKTDLLSFNTFCPAVSHKFILFFSACCQLLSHKKTPLKINKRHAKVPFLFVMQISCLYFLQIYFYADYVFKQSGIPNDKIPYVTVGTGACECITALTCVSMSFTLYFYICYEPYKYFCCFMQADK